MIEKEKEKERELTSGGEAMVRVLSKDCLLVAHWEHVNSSSSRCSLSVNLTSSSAGTTQQSSVGECD